MTDIEKVRLLIGDRPPATLVFTDADIQVFLTDNGDSVRLAAACALEAWAAMYMMNPSNEHIGDYAYAQQVVDNMLALAKRLRDAEAETPVLTWASMDLAGAAEAEE